MAQPTADLEVIRESAVQRITQLVDAEPRDVILLAGGRLAGDLLRAGLVGEVILIVGTVLLGAGRPLFEGLDAQRHLEVLEAEAFPPTTSWLRYRVAELAPEQ